MLLLKGGNSGWCGGGRDFSDGGGQRGGGRGRGYNEKDKPEEATTVPLSTVTFFVWFQMSANARSALQTMQQAMMKGQKMSLACYPDQLLPTPPPPLPLLHSANRLGDEDGSDDGKGRGGWLSHGGGKLWHERCGGLFVSWQ